jgi:hypothetical protein
MAMQWLVGFFSRWCEAKLKQWQVNKIDQSLKADLVRRRGQDEEPKR